jgi:hypothetical protein
MAINPENLQKIQLNLQNMQQSFEAAIAALKNDPTSPEALSQLQAAMGAYTSSVGLAASMTKLQADINAAILGKLWKEVLRKGDIREKCGALLGIQESGKPTHGLHRSGRKRLYHCNAVDTKLTVKFKAYLF